MENYEVPEIPRLDINWKDLDEAHEMDFGPTFVIERDEFGKARISELIPMRKSES